MLSAHQPYETYPEIIKEAVKSTGGVAQFAGGVPAMCDGVTQGQPGMDLSLMSRDVIAMATSVGLSHNMFDGSLMLGICDKIVPGLLDCQYDFWTPYQQYLYQQDQCHQAFRIKKKLVYDSIICSRRS